MEYSIGGVTIMKRKIICALCVVVAILVLGISPALAAKPPRVITLSNGFPSGMHFNLNIHGKDPTTFNYPPPPYNSPFGNSIFIPEDTSLYDPITIKCISEKKGAGTELEVIDPYAMPPTGQAPYGDSTASFKLPYKIQLEDGERVNACGYYVYGRIKGKPNNHPKKEGEPSEIILTPDPILQFDYEGAEWPLGLVTTSGSYKLEKGEFKRFDDTSSISKGKGKGRSIAQNITGMFMWTGWVVYNTTLVDTNDDGKITYHDIPKDYYDGINYNHDYNKDGVEDDADVDAWLTYLTSLDSSVARYYEDWWVFDVADTVVQSWGMDNYGTKLLQIRFYPVATTTFTELAHIVVKKVTDPITDNTTLFDFTTWDDSKSGPYRGDFQMTNNQFCLSPGLNQGTYWVQELAPLKGWALTSIDIDDPTDGGNPADDSSYDLGEAKAYVNLAEGETVIVTFTNAQSQIMVIKEYSGIEPPSTTFDYTGTGNLGTFSLTGDGASYASEYLSPNTYNVTETIPLPAGWALTGIVINDPDGGSPLPSGNTATIDLDPGEVVTVTFTNAYTAPIYTIKYTPSHPFFGRS